MLVTEEMASATAGETNRTPTARRMKLESYGDKRPDASMCERIARRMLPSLKLRSDHVLLLPDLSSRTMEDLLRRAAHEQERNGRAGQESEETRHALCLLYTSPSPRDKRQSRMPSSA